jgi:hypothetical protein
MDLLRDEVRWLRRMYTAFSERERLISMHGHNPTTGAMMVPLENAENERNSGYRHDPLK